MDNSILNLPRDQFFAALAELRLDPQREADLVRQYREANSPLAPVFGLLSRIAGRDADAGMQRASMLPVARPEGMSVAEAVRSGEARFAIPQGVLDMLGGAARGVDAPAAAAQGLIPAQDMTGEAMGTAGVAMGAGGLLSRPAGSVGSNSIRVFHGGPERITSPRATVDPEGLLEGFSVARTPNVAQRYADMRGGGPVSEFEIDTSQLKAINEMEFYDFIADLETRLGVDEGDLTDAQIRNALMDEGFNAISYPDEDFGIRILDTNILKPVSQPTDLSANRSTTTGLLASAASDTPAQRVARLLREGRADEVTDDLMAQADPQELFRLYTSGATGMDLPMDEASRMARAREMGFDVEPYLRHGSKRDFSNFQIGAEQSTDYGWYGQGVSLAPNDPSISDAYAMVEKEGVGQWGGRVYPLTSRGRMYEWPAENPPALNRDQSIEITQSLRDLGYEGANVYAPNDFDTWGDAAGSWRERVIYDPRNIRSRFARFDPRLSHLANLNAANVSPLAGLLATMQAQEPRQ